MSIDAETSAASRAQDVGDPVRESDLERVLKDVPRGALAISVLVVALLLEHLGYPEAAARIETAVAGDLATRGSAPRATHEVGDALAAAVSSAG